MCMAIVSIRINLGCGLIKPKLHYQSVIRLNIWNQLDGCRESINEISTPFVIIFFVKQSRYL